MDQGKEAAVQRIAKQTEIIRQQVETLAQQMETIRRFGESQGAFFMASHAVFQLENERREAR